MRKPLLVALALAAATAAVYLPVTEHGFSSFDDDLYVTENPRVAAGLTLAGLRWAFASTSVNWHPLTWLSHMLDVELFGLHAAGHHLTSLLLHCAGAVLLFLVLRRLSGRLWPAAVTAALFAVHPLHVESVAWVAERKDVLSACFWFLSLGAYGFYLHRPKAGRYGLLLLAFALGLTAKPMLVTLPFVLLLLDYWPLGRIGGPASSGAAAGRGLFHPALRLVGEKIPLLVLAAASAAITYRAQSEGGTIGPEAEFPPGARAANAVLSYCRYLAKTVRPLDLSVFYPYPAADPPPLLTAAALAVLGILTALALGFGRSRPYLAVGWLWFLGTLVPVIGLVQIGGQAMADRYTYLPLVGIFVAACWLGADSLPRQRHGRAALVLLAGAALAALVVLNRTQLAYWKDDATLYRHATEVTADNELAHLNLGVVLFDQGRTDEAIAHYREVLRINPLAEDAHNNLGVALFKQGRSADAMAHLREAIRICPDFADPYNNIGVELLSRGRVREATPYLSMARRLREQGSGRCPGR